MSKINDIQADLVTTFNNITIANSYSVDVKYVDDVVLALEHLSPEDTQAAIAIEWLGEDIDLTDQGELAIARWEAHIGMKNATFLKFTNFYEDIKAALVKEETRNKSALHTFVRSSTAVRKAEKADDRYREATMIIEVIYQYFPETLSGPQ